MRPDGQQIDAWAERVTQKPRLRSPLRVGLRKMQTQAQVLELQEDLEVLIDADRSESTIKRLLTAAQRLARFTKGPLSGTTLREAVTYQNQAAFPTPMPAAGQPWPMAGTGNWEKVTQEQRKDHVKALQASLRRTLKRQGLPAHEADARVRELFHNPPGIKPMPPREERERPELEEHHIRTLLAGLERHRFLTTWGIHMWRFILQVMRCNGPRYTSILLATVGDFREGARRVERPRTPKNKPNPTLGLDEEALAAGLVWLEHHPFAKDPEAPLVLSPKARWEGRAEAPSNQACCLFLGRFARKNGVPFTPGVLAFRYKGHNDSAEAGESSHVRGLRYGRAPKGTSKHGYVRFSEKRGNSLMARKRGLPPPAHVCQCGAALLEDGRCMRPHCPHRTSAKEPTPTQQLLRLLDEVKDPRWGVRA